MTKSLLARYFIGFGIVTRIHREHPRARAAVARAKELGQAGEEPYYLGLQRRNERQVPHRRGALSP